MGNHPNYELQKILITEQTKIVYIFTISLLIFRTVFLIIGLLLPWKFEQNFFESLATDLKFFIFIIWGIIIYFIIILLLTVIQFKKNTKPSKMLSKSNRNFITLPLIWVLITIGYIITLAIVIFSTVWGDYTGIGRILFGYGFIGWIDIITIPNFL